MANSPEVLSIGLRCCGCGTCVAACPASCLLMESDELGFLLPFHTGGCIACGRCVQACPVLTPSEKDGIESVRWAKATDDDLRRKSSSGAIFGLIAKGILEGGGVVYGAAFSNDCKSVGHVRVDSVENLDSVMRSKYVQSSVGTEVYEGLKGDLAKGRRVLFSGTACQCAAVRNYLTVVRAPLDHLLLVDVICHGVPSPRLWEEWVCQVSSEAGAEVDKVNFRSKSTGWLTYSVVYKTTEKVQSSCFADDWYMRAFLRNASIRDSCFQCPSKRSCGSDITLGDFWGIQNIHPEIEDGLGVSAVTCNTKKGETAFKTIEKFLISDDSSIEEVLLGNPCFEESVQPFSERDEFLADVAKGTSINKLRKRWKFDRQFSQKLRGKLSSLKHRVLTLTSDYFSHLESS